MFIINVMKSVNLELHIRIVQFRAAYYVHFSVLASFVSWNEEFDSDAFNLQAPRFLYIGQAFRYSPENAFYVFNQQIYFII